MKKLLALTMTALMCVSLSACGGGSNATSSGSDSAVKAGDTASYAKALKGKKVAVVRNLAAGDHTQQFLDGCVSEGKALGFTVDTFVTDGDDARTQEVTAQCIQKGYDGLIISHAQLSYAYNMLKPAIDKGIKVVTFDSMPLKDGDAKGQLLQGVTSTAQDDSALASLSLGFMMEEFEKNGGKYPIKVLKTFMGPGIPPLDRRNIVYTKLEQEGKIKTVEVIAPSDTANVRGDMTNKTAAILPKYSKGSVDAIWGCYDELAKGVLQSLNDAKRTDIPMYTIDISNDDIQLMLKNKDARIMIGDLGIKTPSEDQVVALLSGGNQQKVVLGKWLNSQSEIYIFDEPTKGIDVGAKREMYQLIERLAEQGKGVLYASCEF